MNIVWAEVTPINPRMVRLIAGRTTGVPGMDVNVVTPIPGPRPVLTPAGRNAPGAAGIQTFLFLQRGNANYAVEIRIQEELRKQDRLVRRIMANHRTGGVLAVADLVVRFDHSASIVVRGRLPN